LIFEFDGFAGTAEAKSLIPNKKVDEYGKWNRENCPFVGRINTRLRSRPSEQDCTDYVVMVAVPYSPTNVTKESQMKSTKLFVPVLGALVVLALSLPVMAQSTSQANPTATPDSSAASQPTSSTAPDSAAPATTKQDSTAPGSMSQDYNAPDTTAPAATKQNSADPVKATPPDTKAPASVKPDSTAPDTDAPMTNEKTKGEMKQ
jgi:hypothetical protein